MRLVVFFSRGMSLEGWERAGILERELALYRHLLPSLEHLAFVTYGGSRDLELGRQIPGVQILPNLDGLSPNWYSLAALWTHRGALRRATLFKTNQINGAWSAVLASRLFGKRLLVRCGFLWADVVARLGAGGFTRTVASTLERWTFRSADRVIVAAAADRDTIVERYGVDPARVEVIPNFVDTARFRPMAEIPREPNRVVCVGRLEEQKNLKALIAALDGVTGVRLAIVGEGSLRDELTALAAQHKVQVDFLGMRPHAELPAFLNQAAVFVLPSLYEGNPKALVEAMACGVPVVGTSVPGIREILVHRQNGYVCGTSADEIRSALTDVLADTSLRERLSSEGIAYVRATCSLEMAVTRELAVLNAIAEPRHV